MATPAPSFSATRSPIYDRIIVDPNYITQPEHLYAYTDTNASSETLYAWTIESDASINNGEITTIYTKTPDPILDTSTGNFTELFDKDGNSYGKNRSDLMGWTLVKNGTSGGETYVNSMDSSVIQLQAVGPT